MHVDLFYDVINILADYYDIPEVWILILEDFQSDGSYVQTPTSEDFDAEVCDLPDGFWESE